MDMKNHTHANCLLHATINNGLLILLSQTLLNVNATSMKYDALTIQILKEYRNKIMNKLLIL